MLNDITSLTLQTAIAGLGARQRVTADNIANLETPGFAARSVAFEASLADAVAAGNPAGARITTDPTADAPGVNGNNVDLETEFVTATKTGLTEQLLTSALTSRFGLITTVLKG